MGIIGVQGPEGEILAIEVVEETKTLTFPALE